MCDSKKRTIKNFGLVFGLLTGLLMLAYFKYLGFFSEIANAIAPSVPILQIVLPVGISFYTFQSLSYVLDVYRGDTKVQKNPLYLALYVSLFPQLIAGPIVRYADVAEEITQRDENLDEFYAGCLRFMMGFGKKMILANTAGEIADAVFAVPHADLSVALAWVGALAYTAQIYFDFSAYSDMAIGLGRMFGFHFLENFNYPYIAKSITEFWRRWHISLSTWFRDYLYIPLGGNRCAPVRHIFNICVVWVATGFWHGASWSFIVWGAYFAAILLIEKYLLKNVLEKIPGVIRHIYTMLLVIISWVIFRAPDLSSALSYLGTMFGIGAPALSSGDAIYYLRQFLPEWILFIVCALPITKWLGSRFASRKDKFSCILCDLVPAIFALIAFGIGYLRLSVGSFNPFIYFRF
jgi:alginate O-acetyltransferase complex protein AlgI